MKTSHRVRPIRRHSPRARKPELELLEDRTLLAAAHVFAHFEGQLGGATATQQINIAVSAADFTLNGGGPLLGFQVEAGAGSALDPAAVQVRQGATTVTPAYARADLANNTRSLVLARLAPGSYTLTVGGERGTAGAFQLDVFLAGDANGDHKVDLTDGQIIRGIYGTTSSDPAYRVEADANLDGYVNAFDYAQWRANNGDATTIRPLALAVSPPDGATAQPDGSFVTLAAGVQVTATTTPGLAVTLETGSDALFDECTLTADPSGRVTFTVPLNVGGNTIQLRAADGFGQQRTASLSVTRRSALQVSARLADDTAPGGGVNADGVTSDPTITGSAAGAVASFRAGLDATAPAGFADALSDLQADGTFTFSRARLEQLFGPLADGPHTLHLLATDTTGNATPVTDVPFTLDTAPPTLSLTGQQPAATNRNLTASGNVADGLSGVVSLTARLDSRTAAALPFDATTGAFLTTTSLPLDGTADGAHVIHLVGIDSAGNVVTRDVPFTLDTQPPAPPVFDLSSTSITPAASGVGHQTAAARVALVGHTDANVTVTLLQTGATALSANTGAFQFPDVLLALGGNPFTVQAQDAAGNTSSYSLTITRTAATGQPNAVIAWNQAALAAIQLDATDPPHASRALAMVQAAVYDAVNAIDGTPAYYVKIAAPAGASAEAAVDQAAYRVLSYLYPAQQAGFDALLAARLALVPAGQAKTDGQAVGQAAGNALVALRAHDGYDTFVNFAPQSGPGQWQPTPPTYAEALDPQWATLTPFAMTGASQFRPAGPPALTSQQWADAVNEVKGLGSATSTTRTADQTQIARFWADGAGTITPAGHWNALAGQIAQQQGDSLAADARLFAELNVAEADAAVVAWDAKFAYTSWRPVAAIRNAAEAGNPAVQADPNWTSFIVTPPFPEYVSGHSTFSAAAAAVLDSFFGSAVGFSSTSAGFTRTFTSFDQAAAEAGRSRIYGGIHFEFANADGQAAGRALAAYVVQTFAVATDTRPPTVLIAAPLPGTVVATNTTITGQVLDNLSGAQKLEVQLDGGAYAAVSFDANGNFALPTTFLLNGSADGAHVFRFRATDYAGNTTDAVALTLTLDSVAPTVSLTTPAAGATLIAGDRLTGTASGTGSALTALSYSFDGGSVTPLTFDPSSGAFDEAPDLSRLAAGSHALVVSARDAAGHTASTAVAVTLAAPVPLTVTAFAPLNGAVDVGTTFRPKVTFSRPVVGSTLNSANFYATGADGAKLPANVVPAADGSFAWLFFTGPMPGASTIALTVDGSTIRAADGSALDAAGSGTAGSKLTIHFTTVSLTSVPGASLSGIVADPGPDLKPGTVDDVKAGPDGVLMTGDDLYLNPIAGVRVYVIGQESQAVFTDAQGRFSFASVPTGDVKLVLDGRTATNAPSGLYYPEMVMALTIRPGQANTVMGSMGTPEEVAAMANVAGVYLPRLRSAILQNVSSTAVTTVGVDATSAPGLTPEQRQVLSIDVQPGSLVGANGQKLSSGQVGISLVPPELVRDMLPPGVLQHTFDITVQAPGITNFSTPAPMTFPNVFHAAPGTQLPFLSFDHTTGMLVIEGTATVSADGLSVRTDPGTGITHPGWHGLTPPGDCASSGGPPPGSPSSASPSLSPLLLAVPTATRTTQPPVALPIIFGQSGGLSDDGLRWQTPGGGSSEAACASPPAHSPSPETVTVTIDIDGPLKDFMTSTGTLDFASFPQDSDGHFRQTFTKTGTKATFEGRAKTYKEMFDTLGGFKALNRDRLYGARITVTEETKSSGKVTGTLEKTYYLYRWVDVIDAEEASKSLVFPSYDKANTAAFLRTLTDLFVRTKQVDVYLPKLAQTSFTGPPGSAFTLGGSLAGEVVAVWKFQPYLGSRPEKDDFQIVVNDPQNPQFAVGGIVAKGTATRPTTIDINLEGFKAELRRVIAALVRLPGPDTKLNTPDDVFRYNFAGGGFKMASDQFKAVFLAPGIDLNARIDQEAVNLQKAFEADYNSANGPVNGYTFSSILPDVRIEWADLGAGTSGASPGDRDSPVFVSVVQDTDLGEAAKEWELAESVNQTESGEVSRVNVATGIDWTSPVSFGVKRANTAAHEVAHTFGLKDAYLEGGPNVDPTPDIMNRYDRATGDLSFDPRHVALLQAALGFEPNGDTPLTAALRLFRKNLLLPSTYPGPEDGTDDPTLRRPEITLSLDGGALFSGAAVRPADVIADRVGGTPAFLSFVISNGGFLPLTLDSVTLAGGASGFSVATPGLAGATLDPGTSVTLAVRFGPTTAGTFQDTLTITSDAGAVPSFQIALTGTAVPRAPTGRLTMKNNNLAGVPLSAATSEAPNLATITNDGSEPLRLSSIRVAEGAGPFTLLGVPADLAAHPVTLARGESFTFGVRFAPDRLGLERSLIEATTNDLTNPVLRFSVVGTGLDSTVYPAWGNDFIAIETGQSPATTVLRTKSDSAGNFSFFLPPNQHYHLVVFDPQTGLVSHGYGITPQSGRAIDLTASLVFGASTAPDTDGDGLPDDVEFTVGTSAAKADTDGDGLNDFAEIEQGLDPLGGRGFPIGVIGSLALKGSASQVVVAGATDGSGRQTAYVATGSYGLAVVDATQFARPVLLGQVELLGNNVDVAVDAARNLAAVADTTAGIHVVDVSDPTRPVLRRTVRLVGGSSHVEVFDGRAYATNGGSLVSIDLATGVVLQTLSLGTNQLTDVVRDGGTLYTMDLARTLRAVTISGGQMTARGSLTLPHGGGRLFAASGIAYATASDYFYGGYVTVNVADPAHLALISDTDVVAPASSPRTVMALNGSGLGLEAGTVFGGGTVLDVVNTSDPANTANFVTRFALPDVPGGLAIASGIAFVADGASGLQVVNYAPFDAKGQAPAAAISTSVADVDPITAGVQVAEGTSIPIRVNVSDDVQVRNVELLVNGQVVANDVSFPFDFSAVAPNITPQTAAATLQVRATDTGGNTALSNALTLNLVRDTVPPAVVANELAEGSRLGRSRRSARVSFSEALAAATVSADTFQVFDATGRPVALSGVQLQDDGRTVLLTFDPLPLGNYQFVIHSPRVTDRAGNPLGSADRVSHFSVGFTISWVNPAGGFWDDPRNWAGGRLPGPDDDVLIDVPGNVTITYRRAEPAVTSLLSKNAFRLQPSSTADPNVMTVTDTIQVDNTFTLAGFELDGATVLPGSGGQGLVVVPGPFGGNFNPGSWMRRVTMNADLTVTGGSTMILFADSLTLNGTATLSNGEQLVFYSFGGTPQALDGTGTVLFAGNGGRVVTSGDSFVDTLVIGPGITVRGHNGSVGNINTGRFDILINRGTIAADGAGTPLTVGAKTFTNGGTLEARNGGTLTVGSDSWTSTGTVRARAASTANLNSTWTSTGVIDGAGGTLNLAGTFTLAGTAFFRSGGTVNLTGTLTNTGQVLALDGSTGSWVVSGGRIKGGTVTTTSGGTLLFTSSSNNTLDGVTLNSDLDLTTGSAVMQVVGTLTVNGTLTLDNGARLIDVLGGSRLAGTGAVVLAGVNGPASGVQVETIEAGLTVRGRNGFIGSPADEFPQYSVTNRGVIAADGAGPALTINGGIFDNSGTLEARNGGSLRVDGSWQNSGTVRAASASTVTLLGEWTNFGTLDVVNGTLNLGGDGVLGPGIPFMLDSSTIFHRAGGTVNLTGTLDYSGVDGFGQVIYNTGKTLALNASTGSWNVAGGGIRGGTVTTADGAKLLFDSNSNNLLKGVTLNTDLDMTGGTATVRVEQFLALNGTLTLDNGARLVFEKPNQASALVGTGQVVFAGLTGPASILALDGGSTTLNGSTGILIGPGITLRGRNGFIGGSVFKVGPGSIINDGQIVADGPGAPLTVQSDFFYNRNTVEARNGGTLTTTHLFNYGGNFGTGGFAVGTWRVFANSTLRLLSADIQFNGANILLDGVNSNIYQDNGTTSALANLTYNIGNSSIAIQNGRNFTSAGAFTNNGDITVGPGSTFTASGTYAQTGGTTTLAGGILSATSLVDVQAGKLSGNGTVAANVSNAGQVNPGLSVGLLTIAGNYTQTAAGSLNVEIGGPGAGTGFDQLKVTGSATLAGTLNLTRINGYSPNVGDTFQVLTYASHRGQFATITGLNLGGGRTFVPAYNAADLTLTTASALQAAAAPLPAPTGAARLTPAALAPLAQEAVARWTAAGGDPAIAGALEHVSFQVVDLSGAYLGGAAGDTVWIDADAAGYGWFVDPSPADDAEFGAVLAPDEFRAAPASAAAGHMDLLSVVAHELGHVLGLEHAGADDVMGEALEPGVRRVPDGRDLAPLVVSFTTPATALDGPAGVSAVSVPVTDGPSAWDGAASAAARDGVFRSPAAGADAVRFLAAGVPGFAPSAAVPPTWPPTALGPAHGLDPAPSGGTPDDPATRLALALADRRTDAGVVDLVFHDPTAPGDALPHDDNRLQS